MPRAYSKNIRMIGTLVTALRVYQWPKNLVVFGALVFALQLGDAVQVTRSVVAFLVMCAASSTIYLLNDLIDIEKDRAHPEKKNRPIASGALRVPVAVAMLLVLGACALIVAFALRVEFAGAVICYLVLNLAYSFVLKNIMLVDVMAIAISFVIRGIAGALVISVEFSNWLVVCTLFLALFLALGKRRREIGLLEEEAIKHREVLGHYSVPYLDALMVILAATTLLAYTIYTCSPEVVERLHTDKLYVSLPFVVYGLFRYLYLVHHKSGGGDPSRTLVRDVPLLTTVLLWGLTNVAIIYGRSLI
ncbi:MAG: decaprenyl-phosphate phosphoribosyltransferase [Candidatus Hydrogenedentes bacterium]|nr:decaprenyl-phosphate phosphoribosyltransferase [Candidatus Hydrogenedentota bacterium]